MSAVTPSSPAPKRFGPIPDRGIQPLSASEKSTAPESSISPELVDKILESPVKAGPMSLRETGVLPLSEVSHKELEMMASQISEAVEAAVTLEKSGSEAAVSIRDYIEENSSEIISKLVEDLQSDPTKVVDQPERLYKTAHSAANTFLSSLAFVSREASGTIGYLRFEKDEALFGADALHSFKGIEVGIVLLKLLGAGGSAVVIQSLINQVNKEIELKRSMLAHAGNEQRASLEREIKLLSDWVKLHHRSLSDQLRDTLVAAVLAFPKVGSCICTILEKGGTTISNAFGGLCVGVGLFGSVWEWYKTRKDVSRQKVWMQGFCNQGITSEDAKKLVAKQKKIFADKLAHNLPLLKDRLQPIIARLKEQEHVCAEEQEKLLREALLQLKEQGFKLAPKAPHGGAEGTAGLAVNLKRAASPGELREMLQSSEVQHVLNMQMVRKGEALSGSLRNALKAFILKKGAIERGFLKWELMKAKISTSAVFVMAGLWLAIKAAILPAVIGGAVTGLVVSGYGMLALAVVLLIVSLAYLYYKKPNVFKTMCKGVYAELALRKIPLAIQQYRRQSALLDILTVAERSQAVSDNMLALQVLQQTKDKSLRFEELPDPLKKYMQEKSVRQRSFTPDEIEHGVDAYRLHLEAKLKRYEEKMDVLNKRVLELNASVEGQEKRINMLQEQVREAGWKDYQHLLRQEMPKTQEAQEDDATTLATFLLSDEGLLQDPDIISIMEQMNIDLPALRAAPHDRAVKEAAKAVQSFFAMDDRELLHAVRTYKRKVKIASSH